MMVFPIVGCWHFPILESWGLLLLQTTLFWSPAPIQANTRGDDQNINTPLWTDKCSSAFCNWSFFMLEWTGLFLSSNEGRKFRPPDTSRWMYLKCTFLKWRLKGCIFTPGFNSQRMVLAQKPVTPCNPWKLIWSLKVYFCFSITSTYCLKWKLSYLKMLAGDFGDSSGLRLNPISPTQTQLGLINCHPDRCLNGRYTYCCITLVSLCGMTNGLATCYRKFRSFSTKDIINWNRKQSQVQQWAWQISCRKFLL